MTTMARDSSPEINIPELSDAEAAEQAKKESEVETKAREEAEMDRMLEDIQERGKKKDAEKAAIEQSKGSSAKEILKQAIDTPQLVDSFIDAYVKDMASKRKGVEADSLRNELSMAVLTASEDLKYELSKKFAGNDAQIQEAHARVDGVTAHVISKLERTTGVESEEKKAA